MDYVTQDCEDMRVEAGAWKVEASRQSDSFERELRETNETLSPLLRVLCEKEEAVRDVTRRILAAKTSVSRNDSRIQEILRMATLKNTQAA